jgi:hypothetical protein
VPDRNHACARLLAFIIACLAAGSAYAHGGPHAATHRDEPARNAKQSSDRAFGESASPPARFGASLSGPCSGGSGGACPCDGVSLASGANPDVASARLGIAPCGARIGCTDLAVEPVPAPSAAWRIDALPRAPPS